MSVAIVACTIVALLVTMNEGVLRHCLHFWKFGLSECVLFEQEVICLISEFLLKLQMQIVFAAVEDELFRISTLNLAEATGDWRTTRWITRIEFLDRRLSCFPSVLLIFTCEALCVDDSSLEVQLVLERESRNIVLLPEACIPILIYATREHEHDL